MPSKFTTSVNIIRDSQRDLNYIPTPNGAKVVNQICNDFKKGTRSFNIIGSYGTGKSSFLWAFQQSISGIKKHFDINLLSKPKVDFINIVGEYKSIKEVFADHFNVKNNRHLSENIFSEIYNHYHDLGKGNSILFIVLDEFGKFLEFAAQNEPEKELYFIQQLAEFANNPDYNIVLFTTVHQSFDAYAISLQASQKHEWTKVKGRFKEITFNEPVEQLLFLAAEHLSTRASAQAASKEITKSIELFIKSKAFSNNPDYVTEIAEKLYPLDIIAANIITTSLQKYGQNERSLFSFLESNDNTGIIFHTLSSADFYGIPHVYDYLIFNFYSFINSRFNPDFSAWQSIKSALEECERTFDKDINNYCKLIKTIGLLNISSAAGSTLDKTFLTNYSKICLGITKPEDLIETLEKKKIILYRNYSKRYVLFEGTDLDIQTALIEAGNKVSDVTDVATLLNKYYQLPPITAKEETYKKGTPRLFEYRISAYPINEIPENEIDGFINLVFNETANVDEILEHSKKQKEAILYGFYKNSKSVRDLLFEIEKTRKVIEENEGDKVAVRELTNIILHQQNLLNYKILNNFNNTKKEIAWIFKGEEHVVNSKKDFNKLLSYICGKVYSKAPIFNNELVNKHKISASIHTAKKSYFKALVNNWDKFDLDFPKDKFPPEKTIYLSLLKNNGIELDSDIFQQQRIVSSEKNFHHLWRASLDFLEGAKVSRRKVVELNEMLSRRPFKLKQGLIDFWVPTFLFINRDDFALFNEDGYIPYLTEEVLELMTKYPDQYEIKTFAVEGIKLNLFNRYRAFLNQNSENKLTNNTFIETIKPFLTFYKGLPEYSKSTRRISPEALSVRHAISNSKDPEQTFFSDFPTALGFNVDAIQNSSDDLQNYIKKLQEAIRELRTTYDELVNRIEGFIQSDLVGESVSFELYKKSLQLRYKNLRRHLLLPKQRTFVQRVDSQLDDRKAWLNSIVQAVIGKTLEKINDEDEAVICDKLRAMIIELDTLTEMSVSDFIEEKEDVVSLEISSFSEGAQKKIVRLPKEKNIEITAIESTVLEQLSSDDAVNIAALTNVLKKLLQK